MDYLPNELLVKIFDLLPLSDVLICRLVCKHWNNIANARPLHEKVWFCIHEKNMFPIGIKHYLKSTVTKLILHDVVINEDMISSCDVEYAMSSLTSLEMKFCDINGKDLVNLLKKCRDLQTLRLINIDNTWTAPWYWH